MQARQEVSLIEDQNQDTLPLWEEGRGGVKKKTKCGSQK